MPVDVMHFHVDFPHYPLVRHCPTPCLSTLHGRPDLPGLAPLHHHRACRAAFERRFTAHRMAQHCLEVSAALSGASSGAGDSDTSEPDAALGSTGTGK